LRLRILLWYWGRRGGGAQFALGLARALANRADVALDLSLSAYGELNDAFPKAGQPPQIIETYRDVRGFVASLPRIQGAARELIARARVNDVVVSAMSHSWTPFVATGLRRAGIPFVPVIHDATPHPGDPTFAWNWRLGRELGSARAAITLSGAVAQALSRRAPALPIILMGLPALLVGDAPPRLPGAARFLFFGRFRAYKGLDLLRDAFALLHARHPEATLRVVGEGNIEACAPGLVALRGVTVEARWVPDIEIPALFAAADAVVLPYREASQSGVVPQALALGVPVVGSPVGGLPEQLSCGGSIMMSEVSSPALAAAMAAILVPAVASQLQEEAVAAGRAACDWRAAADTLVRGLRRIL